MKKITYIGLSVVIIILFYFAIVGLMHITKTILCPGEFRCGDFFVGTKMPYLGDAGIIITSTNRSYPFVIFQQRSYTNKENELIGYISVVDNSKDREIRLEYDEGRGEFKSLIYNIGLTSNNVSYRDNDMDGEYDTRLGPEKKKALFINGKWHDIQVDKSEMLVKDGDRLGRVVIKNGKKAIDFEDGVRSKNSSPKTNAEKRE